VSVIAGLVAEEVVVSSLGIGYRATKHLWSGILLLGASDDDPLPLRRLRVIPFTEPLGLVGCHDVAV